VDRRLGRQGVGVVEEEAAHDHHRGGGVVVDVDALELDAALLLELLLARPVQVLQRPVLGEVLRAEHHHHVEQVQAQQTNGVLQPDAAGPVEDVEEQRDGGHVEESVPHEDHLVEAKVLDCEHATDDRRRD
jgi:hypothetical protein